MIYVIYKPRLLGVAAQQIYDPSQRGQRNSPLVNPEPKRIL